MAARRPIRRTIRHRPADVPARAHAAKSQTLVASAAALLLASATGTAAGERAIASGLRAIVEAADLIAARSPGERLGEQMIKGPRPELGRVARALSRVRAPAPEAAAPRAAAAGAPAAAPPFAEGAGAPAGESEYFGAPAAAGGPEYFGFFPGFPGDFGGGPIGIIGGGGGGGGGTPPVAPGAVPEPSVWATLILGFGAIGASIRRRRGRAPVTHADAG